MRSNKSAPPLFNQEIGATITNGTMEFLGKIKYQLTVL
jgi:hypothetical protein